MEVRLNDAYLLPNGQVTGRLEVRLSSSGAWGSVCDDNFEDIDAQTACLTLGLLQSGATTNLSVPAGSGAILMDEVACVSTNMYLYQCAYSTTHDCTRSEDVGITCSVPAGTTITLASSASSPSSPSSGSGPLWSGVMQYRIAGGGSSGRLEVLPAGETEWGTVCNDLFDDAEATVACRSMEYESGSVKTDVAPGTGPIYLDDLQCTGSEYELSVCPRNQGRADCEHYEDAGVTCSNLSSGALIGIIVGACAVVVIFCAVTIACVCRKASPPPVSTDPVASEPKMVNVEARRDMMMPVMVAVVPNFAPPAQMAPLQFVQPQFTGVPVNAAQYPPQTYNVESV
jgi:hypothetical protein